MASQSIYIAAATVGLAFAARYVAGFFRRYPYVTDFYSISTPLGQQEGTELIGLTSSLLAEVNEHHIYKCWSPTILTFARYCGLCTRFQTIGRALDKRFVA